MSYSPEAFENVVEGVFTPAELEIFDQLFSGRLVQPLYPGREELLEHFDELATNFDKASNHLEAEKYQESFLANLSKAKELELGMNMMLTSAWSCVANFDVGKYGYTIFEQPTKFSGRYIGLSLGSWFDTPLGEGMPEDEVPFFKSLGLFVCMQEVVVEQGDASGELSGVVSVSLNHGKPELFRILRAE